MEKLRTTLFDWATKFWLPIVLALLGGGLLRTNQTANQAHVATEEQGGQMMMVSERLLALEGDVYDLKAGVKPRMAKVETRVKMLEKTRLERPRSTLVPQRAAAAGDTVARSPGLMKTAGNAVLAPFRWLGRKVKGE